MGGGRGPFLSKRLWDRRLQAGNRHAATVGKARRAAFQRRKLRIPRPAAGGRPWPLRCASSPHRARFAGLRRGPDGRLKSEVRSEDRTGQSKKNAAHLGGVLDKQYNESALAELRCTTCCLQTVLREFLSCFPLILRDFPAFCLSVIRCADHKKRHFFIQQ